METYPLTNPDHCTLHCYSVVEPEPDFFAGAGAGEKAPVPGSYCVAQGYCDGKVAIILVKFSHILTIYTQI